MDTQIKERDICGDKEPEFEEKQTYEEGVASQKEPHAYCGDTTDLADAVLADTACEANRQVGEGSVNAQSPELEGDCSDDNGVDLICIDDDDDPLVVKVS